MAASSHALLNLHQDLVRVDAVALLDMYGTNSASDGGLDFGFHFHRLGDQQWGTGLHLITLGCQDVDYDTGHGGGDVTGGRGLGPATTFAWGGDDGAVGGCR